MPRVPALALLAVLPATLALSGCDPAGDGTGERTYPHETGAACLREAVAADCDAAEALAEDLLALDGVEDAEFEFRTIDGEGINELIVVIAAADEATSEEVAGAITVGLRELPTIDADRDLSLAVTRAGANLHLDPADTPDPAQAAGILVAAGALSSYGTVQTSLSPAEIWVQLPSDKRYGDVSPVAHAVAELDLDPAIDVVISSGGSYLSRKDLTEEDAAWWDRLVAAAVTSGGVEVTTIGVSGNDTTVTVDAPGGIRPQDFTFEEYGDGVWPMAQDHLDLVRELGDGASYEIDTNWPANEDGFDIFLSAVVGPKDGGPDPRGWNEAAEAYLDR